LYWTSGSRPWSFAFIFFDWMVTVSGTVETSYQPLNLLSVIGGSQVHFSVASFPCLEDPTSVGAGGHSMG